MKRRDLFRGAAALTFARTATAAPKKRPRILLRSSWQVVNIGDIAHTPGVLALLERHIPEAEVMLWASQDLSPEVAEMEHKRFPKLQIVKGDVDADGKTDNKELDQAIGWCDFLLHGSGPSMVAHKDVNAVHKRTGKPYGVYGITYAAAGGAAEREGLDKARFVFFRDTVSLGRAKREGVKSPVLDFGPDGAFAVDLKNDQAATRFMDANGLVRGKFLVVLPRLRYTPYWKIRNRPMTAQDKERWARSQAMKEADHAKLRAAMITFVRETGMKALVCPEDQSQMEVGKENIVDKLPDDVKAKTVWRPDYWLTDEAVSVYERAFAMLSLEMHSPIMALARGLPTVLCRFPEQTSKGFMWRDIGLDQWLFDLDTEVDGGRITRALMDITRDPRGARATAARAMAVVKKRQRETMQVLRKELGLA